MFIVALLAHFTDVRYTVLDSLRIADF